MVLSLREIKIRFGLSRRAENVLKSGGLNDSKEILQFYEKRRSFLGLKNSGRKTNMELLEICKLLKNIQNNPVLISQKKSPKINYDHLLRSTMDVLSQRSRNILNRILSSEEVTDQTIFRYTKKDYYLSVPNCGSKTRLELIAFFKKIISDENLIQDYNDPDKKLLLKFSSCLRYDHIDFTNWLKSEGIEFNGTIEPFQFLDYHLRNTIKKRDYEIVKTCFGDEVNNELAIIGVEYSLSRERIRQIRNSSVQRIKEETLRFKSALTQAGISLRDYFNEEIFVPELSEFKLEEIWRIPKDLRFLICALLYDKYELVLEDSHKHNYKFLTIPYVNEKINLKRLIKEIEKRKSERRDYKIKINVFEEFRIDSGDLVLKKFLLQFIWYLYGLTMKNGVIELPRTTKKKVPEYIIEILEQAQTPLNVEEIARIYNSRFPDQKRKSGSSIRSNCLNSPDIVVYGSSIYGLKKWEDEGKMVSGTIRDVVYEYLDKASEPKHLQEITEYVNKFREETNKRNLKTNLELAVDNRFIFYKGGFIGLSNKRYNPRSTQFNYVSKNWYRYFEKNLMVNQRSIYDIEKTSQLLAKSLNVKPIQIKSLIIDRIEAKKLKLDRNHFLYAEDEDLNTLGDLASVLSADEEKSIKSLIDRGEHLNAMQKAMGLFLEKGVEVDFEDINYYLSNL